MKKLIAILLVCGCAVLADESFHIEKGNMPHIVVEDGMRPFVARAIEDVSDDLLRIFGERVNVVTGNVAQANAIVLTRGRTGFETYSLKSGKNNVLHICGSDDRGVMFALYRFASDFLKVDPLWWFARTPNGTSQSHAPRDKMSWGDIDLKQGEPSFRYRAWFVNDEDFLNGLNPESNGKRAIDYPRYHACFGTEIADRIYEAAVRCGFNTMVCASYVDVLNPDERRLVDVASSRGLYITMHHQEPVGAGALMLDVHFPEMKGTTYASHPHLWRKAWQRYVSEWAKYPDVIFQIGLRGRKDRAFWETGSSHSVESGAVSEEETRRRARLISDAMREQHEMIRKATGNEHPLVATQLWMEGADFYKRGLLGIPEDATVIFADNSPGLKFQPDVGSVAKLPSGRSYGLYYHLAIVTGNHRCEIVPPSRTCEVLRDVHAKGAKELLLVNVSNVRPFLYTLAGMSEMARDLNGFDAEAFARAWTQARFGKGAVAAKRAIDLYFAGLETELSRDDVSAYASPRGRAVLPMFNDGIVWTEIAKILGSNSPNFGGAKDVVGDPVSPYVSDPDALAVIPDDQRSRTTGDMRAYFLQRTRLGPRAAAQVAGMTRCLDACESAMEKMSKTEREVFFQSVAYQAEFTRLACECLSELSLWRDVKENRIAAHRHLSAALKACESREILDRRYASGVWANWYQRDLIYPYSSFTDKIRKYLGDR